MLSSTQRASSWASDEVQALCARGAIQPCADGRRQEATMGYMGG
jgi:hypothetical protein